MEQEKIGKIIKDIRIKNKLSQKEFAQKYGVTYQAVSKWENGKNIPDISILKQICNDYNINLDDLLDARITKKNYLKNIIGVILIIILTIGGAYILFRDDDFEFKTISSTCDEFKLHGSVAYNKNKSSIYIDGLTYCGEKNIDKIKYEEIKCTLYEDIDKIKNEISSYEYSKSITLEEFLKDVKFKVDDYEQTCKTYDDNSLYLEIEALTKNNNIVYYKIPLSIEDTCTK